MKKFFGTDGYRGVANVDLTADYAYLIGRFLALKDFKRKRILIAKDTRVSSDMIEHALITGILVSGGDAFCLGVTSTPCMAYLTSKHEFDYGVMISASHNPYYDNGIKIFSKEGIKISDTQEKIIEQYLNKYQDNIPKASSLEIGRSYDVKDYIDEYVDYLLSIYDFKNSKQNFVLDLANGALCPINEKFNFSNVISVQPSGFNINENCGATSLNHLSSTLKEQNLPFGFAFDGDGDRLQGVLYDGTIISGDQILFLLGNYLKKKNELKENGVVITVMTNMGLIKYFDKVGIKYSIVGVGDRPVQEEMDKKGYVLGGEQSGHIIINKYLPTGDGLLTFALILKVIEEENKSLKDLVKDLYIYPQILENVKVEDKTIIQHDEFKTYLSNCIFSLGDKGRILVRPSGTEKLIRVMVEAEEEEVAIRYTSLLVNKIKSMIK